MAAFYLVENWRGAKRFEQASNAWAAMGGSLDYRTYIPAPIPDEDNAAAHSLLKPLSQRPKPVNSEDLAPVDRVFLPYERPPRYSLVPKPSPFIETESDLFTTVDLVYWQSRFRQNTNFPAFQNPSTPAGDVLLALSKFQVELQDLHEALSRRKCRFPLPYDENPDDWLMSHLSGLKRLADVLRVKAAALIEDGKAEEAAETIGDLFSLADTIKHEPTIVSFQVHGLIRAWGCDRILQGVQKGSWILRHLNSFQQALIKQNFFAEGDFVLKADTAYKLRSIDLGFARDDLFRLAPQGWFDHNKAALADYARQFALRSFSVPERRVSPSQLEVAMAEHERITISSSTPYTLFGATHGLYVNKLLRRLARAQTGNDLTLVACAIEHYRLDNGHLPETFSSLTPTFLPAIPSDVMSGQPLQYRREADGECTVWSVGWNQRDDGGKVKRHGKRLNVAADSDWLVTW